MSTGIQWTDETWNPTVGCDQVSPGCAKCYAKTLHDRRHKAFLAGKKVAPQYAQPFEVLQMLDNRLDAPLRWRKPRRIFVNSVSDLFHADVPDAFIDRVFAVMASASQHTFQVLTKRPERMKAYFARVAAAGPSARDRYVTELRAYHETTLEGYKEGFTLPRAPTSELRFIYDSAAASENKGSAPMDHGFSGGEYHWRPWPLSNVWLGVSVENQRFADERIPLLLQTPAAIRFISAEPLLGPVRLLSQWMPTMGYESSLPRLDWVIVGGESGSGARPFDIAWARSIVQECREAHDPFTGHVRPALPVFVKQLGTNPHERVTRDIAASEPLIPHVRLRHHKGGDPAEWPADLRVREFPKVRA